MGVRHPGGVETWQRAVAHVAERVAAAGGGPPLAASARVVVHLHPDRAVAATGRPVLAQLVLDGRYRSQFETGTSAGGLTAHPGGDRWRWESELFGEPSDAALRFGSCHLRLHPGALRRITLAFPDSAHGPEAFGTAQVAAAEASRAVARFDLLDDYVEAHVHGQLLLARDVEAVVLDPCFRGTAVEAAARELRTTAGAALEWHAGRAVDAAALAERRECVAYRGPEVVRAAREVAEALTGDGVLDAAVVGREVALDRWDAQRLKQLWHCVARFGHPRPPA